ncbi:recombinase family protein [Flavobacterium ustbae]|uniref:recombinase family protein n=1 Tax=Flavobacterium ustbae TaxID=2488790 RepID=UPI000F77F959|nr:recombinase family protein [Flavobacterium ustbae]
MITTAKYIRVSSKGQNEARQKDSSMVEYFDTISGVIPFTERPEAIRLLEDVRTGKIKTIVVHSVDRLGRNAYDIQTTMELLNREDINLIVENLGLHSRIDGRQNPIFKMICDLLANVSQIERESIKERIAEGIAIAKTKGKYKGRVKGIIETNEEFLSKYKSEIKLIKNDSFSLSQLNKMTNISINTIRKIKSML